MTSYVDYAAPGAQFAYDVNQSTFYRKDANNYINILSSKQINTLKGTSLLDVFLSKGNLIEPHYHQNASELVYCISGAVEVAMLNPFTNAFMNYRLLPGQAANIPQGWWHYDFAIADHTHLLAIFDAPVPEVIFGSDILRLTPPGILAYSYCLNETQLKQALAPLNKTVMIGPPAGCHSPSA